MNIDWHKLKTDLYEWLLLHTPRIVLGIIILLFGLWFIRIFSKWLKKVFTKKKIDPSLRYFLQNFFVITLQILVFFLSFQLAGFQLNFLTAIFAGLTVAAGLALSGTLQNFVNGILILLLHPFRVGDTLSTQGLQGTVTSIQIFFTTILTFDNKTIIVPNGQLSNNVIINLSKEGIRRLDIEVKLLLKTDVKKAKHLLMTEILNTEGILQTPAPRIGIRVFESDRFILSMQVWTMAHGYEDLNLKLNEKVQRLLFENGLFG